ARAAGAAAVAYRAARHPSADAPWQSARDTGKIAVRARAAVRTSGSCHRCERRSSSRGGGAHPEGAEGTGHFCGMSERIDVALQDRSYAIHVGSGLLNRAGTLIAPLARGTVPV